MELFDYQSFEVTTKFLKNRDVVVWCTKLTRSDANERVDVEVAMREKGLGWILRELAGDRQAKTQTGDAMDVDEQVKSAQAPKTTTLAPGSVVQPKKTVDCCGDRSSAQRRGTRKSIFQPPNRSLSRRVDSCQLLTCQNGHGRNFWTKNS